MSFLSRFTTPISMASPMSIDSRRRLLENDSKWHIKLVLRTITAVFSLIAFSLFAAAIPQWNSHFFHVSGPNAGDWQDGMPIAALLVSFLYNMYAITHTILTYRQPHPVFSLIIGLLTWGLLIPSITFAAWGGLFEVWRPALKASNGRVVCNILNSFAKECNPILYSIGGLELGGVVISCFVWFLEVTLFIFSCLATHRWRQSRGTRLMGGSGDGRFVELGERRNGGGQFEADDLGLLKEVGGGVRIDMPKKAFGRGR